MAFNKNKKIVTTALTAAMVASAVAPVAAATKTVTPVQAATKAVDNYYKLSVKTRADVSNSAKVKVVAQKAIAKLTSKKDAKVKASLTAKVAKKSAAINKYYKTVIVPAELEAKNIATAKAALAAAKAFVPTAETKVEDVEKMFVDGMALINKIKTASVKADLTKQAEELKAAVLKKIEELKVAKIDSVKAIGAKKLEVKFASAVDTAKAVVSVKKGTSVVSTKTVTFSADKKSAVLELNNKLTAGTYTVSVSGLTETALTKDVVATDEVVGEIKFLSDKAIEVAGGTKAQVGYQVLNQYGEDVTSTSLANIQAVVAGVANANVSVSAGSITIDNNYAVDNKVSVTLIDTVTGKTINQTFTVIAEAKASDITVNSLYSVNNKVLDADTATNGEFFLTVDVKDQYGNKITDLATLNTAGTFTIIPSNAAVSVGAFTTKKINNVDTLVLPVTFTGTVAKGDYAVTFVANASGKAVQHKLTVAEGTFINSVSVTTPDGILAGNETAKFGLEVKDNKGNLVTDVTKINAAITKPAGTTVVVEDGKTYLSVTLADNATNLEQTQVVTVSVTGTGSTDTKVVKVKPNAVPTAIIGVKSDVLSTVFKGETLTYDWANLLINDQYGREYKGAESAAYKVVATDATPTDGPVTLTTADTSVAGAVAIKGAAKGSESITLKLQKQNGAVYNDVTGSATDISLRTVELSEFVSYGAEDLGKLYANGTAFDHTTADKYNKELKVFGTTADGKKVYLPKTAYTVNTTATDIAYNDITNTVDAKGDNKADTTLEKSLNIGITINDNGFEFTKAVAISEVAPVVDKVEVIVATKAVTALDYTVDAEFDSADIAGLTVTDSYGVENAALATIDRITFSNLKEKNTATSPLVVTGNGTATAKVTGAEAGDTFDATIYVGGKALKLAITAK